MADERFIVAIGRIERALSRIEKLSAAPAARATSDIVEQLEKLKSETRAAIHEIDKILAGAG
jgi:hypothetical protein